MIEINDKTLCESCFSVLHGEEVCPCCGFDKAEFVPDLTALPMGTKLNDKIVVGSVMGKGGFGITYLGYDLRMDKVIAIKEYCPNGISYRVHTGSELAVTDPKSAEIFEQGAQKFYTEAEMVSQFNGNPNIMGVYDYFRANNTVYLIMEYLSGITLKNYIKRHGKLSDGQALFVMDKIAAALVVTHSAGVLHRDISPDNIMICADGKVKLIDFGAAREILSESASNLTVVMKPGYTPIEQYTKKGMQGAWTDIYSLGVSVYYALTGVVLDDPYSRMDSDEEMDGNKHNINESLWTILKKCTMINASDRYGSAVDLRKALRTASAPLKAEAITLNEDDLKKETEEIADTEAVSEAYDDIPATMLGDSSDIPEAIQKFESGNTVPGANEINVPETDKDNRIKLAGDWKKLLPFICAGAGLIAVVVICLIIGLNSNKVPVDANVSDHPFSTAGVPGSPISTESVPPEQNSEYSAGYPEMIDGKLRFEIDTQFGGDGKRGKGISKKNFLRFDGDVKITLDMGWPQPPQELAVTSGRGLIQFKDRTNRDIKVTAFNNGSRDGYYAVILDMNTYSVTVSREDIEKMDEVMYFVVGGAFVKTAVLEAYNPAESKPSPDALIVDIGSSGVKEHEWDVCAPIFKETLESFGGDVRVTLSVEYKYGGDPQRDDAVIHTHNAGHGEFALEVENNSPVTFFADPTYNLCKDFPDTFTFIIRKEEIAKLTYDRGLVFNTMNLYISTAALEAVSAAKPPESSGSTESKPPVSSSSTASKPPVSSSSTASKPPVSSSPTESKPNYPEIIDGKMFIKLNSSYPGAGRYSSGISQSALEAYGSDVKITLDIEHCNDVPDNEGRYRGSIYVIDNHDELVAVNAYNMITDDYGMYFVGGDKFVFSVTKESIASLGGKMLRFRGYNLFVKSAVIEKYDPDELKPGSGATYVELDSSYPGDYKFGKMIPKSELEAFGGDVKITLYTERAVASNYAQSDGREGTVSWLDPVIIAKNGEEPIPPLTIGDNLARPLGDSAGLCIGPYSPNAPKTAPETITFVLPQSEIGKPGQGLAFKTYGFYIKKAALEKAP